jgi:TolA-binding protein
MSETRPVGDDPMIGELRSALSEHEEAVARLQGEVAELEDGLKQQRSDRRSMAQATRKAEERIAELERDLASAERKLKRSVAATPTKKATKKPAAAKKPVTAKKATTRKPVATKSERLGFRRTVRRRRQRERRNNLRRSEYSKTRTIRWSSTRLSN